MCARQGTGGSTQKSIETNKVIKKRKKSFKRKWDD